MPIDITRLSVDGLQQPRHHAALTDVLVDAVNGSGASVSFVAPLTHDEAAHYWQSLQQKIAAESVVLFVALDTEADERIVGTVQLALAWQPNAPHRAEIHKLLVHSDYRRQGIATRLMHAAERAARQRGRWLLMLDTEVQSGAQYLYEALGWSTVGVIPQHAINSAGAFADTVLFCKVLATSD